MRTYKQATKIALDLTLSNIARKITEVSKKLHFI